MLIRDMQLRDIRAVAEIEKECFTQPWSAKSFEDSINRDDTVFFVCYNEETSDVLGYIGMYISFDEAEITNVAVAPDYRGCGFAEMLVEAAKETAATLGVTQIFLEVRKSNDPAISLYKKTGFEEIGIRRNFYQRPTEDAKLMKVGI